MAGVVASAGVSGSTAPWCAIFRSGPEAGAYCYKKIGLKALRSCFDRQQAELGLKFRKIKAMHGATLCGVACKRDKEVLVVCTAAGRVLSSEVLAPVGSGNVTIGGYYASSAPTKNEWEYVPVLSKQMHSDNYVAFEKLVRSRPQTGSSFENKTVRRSVPGRPPRWQNCQQPGCNLVKVDCW